MSEITARHTDDSVKSYCTKQDGRTRLFVWGRSTSLVNDDRGISAKLRRSGSIADRHEGVHELIAMNLETLVRKGANGENLMTSA